MTIEPIETTAAPPKTGRRQSTVHVLPPGDPMGEGELGIGAYFAPRPEHGLMTWEHIQRVVAQDDLDHLVRHPECENRYLAWGEGIRAHYGGLENYIREIRLGWKGDDNELAPPPDGMNGSGIENVNEDPEEVDPKTFFSDLVANDPNLVRTVPNDWPYAMPAECGHSVVWCKRPILDKILFADKDTPFPKGPIREAVFAAINHDGIRGLSGSERQIPPLGFKTRDFLNGCPEVVTWMKSDGRADNMQDEVAKLAAQAQMWAGRFIDKFVKKHWPEKEWETAYFCNPPHLRTVPGAYDVIILLAENPDFSWLPLLPLCRLKSFPVSSQKRQSAV